MVGGKTQRCLATPFAAARSEFVVSVRCVPSSDKLLTNRTWSLIEPGAAARPCCVIGVSVLTSVVDKLACPNWAVSTGIS